MSTAKVTIRKDITRCVMRFVNLFTPAPCKR
jgi:hypothetical protein